MIGTVVGAASCGAVAHHDHLIAAVLAQQLLAQSVVRLHAQSVDHAVGGEELLVSVGVQRMHAALDGLDPLVRRKTWKYIIDDVAEREMTVLVSSHNLREMEGYCDHIGIISEGKMIIERDLEDLKSDVHKVQVAFRDETEDTFAKAIGSMNIMHHETRGSVHIAIIRESAETIQKAMQQFDTPVMDLLPLTLEEIFVYELGGDDHEITGII